MVSSPYHEPVMLNESIEGLIIKPNGIYTDATFGGGGHSLEILKRLKNGRLIAFDKDMDATQNKLKDKRFTLVQHNFRYLKNFLKYYNAIPVDGILVDLGVSSHQFNEPSRGFAFRMDSALDMRMDTSAKVTAAYIINKYTLEKLHKIFGVYGEIKNAKTLAKTIVTARTIPIKTTSQFIGAIEICINKKNRNQYLAQVFQAIRIEVNKELECLAVFLKQCSQVIKSGGRLVIISYHSLEDRMVKNFIQKGNVDGNVQKDVFGNIIKPFNAVFRKPITANHTELVKNSRSRSAKLRIAEKN